MRIGVEGPWSRRRAPMALVASLLALLGGGAQAQPTQAPPPADRRVEYQIDALRLSVPLAFHQPIEWSDPPKGNPFRPFPNALQFVLMWPNLTDATDPVSQRCIEPGMRLLCRDAVDVSVFVASPLADQTRQTLKAGARPAVVGMLHGFEVSRQTVPGSGANARYAKVYLKPAAPGMGDPEKIEGECGGSWQGTTPESLPEIERQLLTCVFYWQATDKVRVSILTFAQGFTRWKELYARVEGLLREWQRAAGR